jgi:protein-disulfide isomerase/uncharacterized membrane protein
MSTDKQHSPGKKVAGIFLIAIAVLALTGLGLAVELTSIHANTHQNPEFHSLCAISEGLNCETVALSPYSVFLELPVSVWGILGYLLILVLSGISLKLNQKTKPLLGAVFGFSALSFLSSALLAWISFTRIDSLCLFCMGTYLVNTLLVITSSVLLWKSRLSPVTAIIHDLKYLQKAPALLLFILAAGVLPMGVAYAQIKPYWHTVGFESIAPLPTGVDKNGDHWIGAQNPRITIIEYTDYECPYCRKAHRELRDLLSKYAEDVRVVHRHFPLDQACNPNIRHKFHQFACHFSKAVECAAHGDKFWEMNDAIFSGQDTRKSDAIDVEKFAIQLGLDRSEFRRCIESNDSLEEIQRNINEGTADKVVATPTFVVNGQQFKGRLTEEQLDRLLQAAD